MKNILNIFLFGCGILLLHSCEEPYEPEIGTSAQSILVVEGHITDSTSIRLSRSTPLSDNGFDPESGAYMEVESEKSGVVAILTEVETGVYEAVVPVEAGASYRLKITTDGGVAIISDWVTALPSPEIDKLYYELAGGELQVYLDSEAGDSTGYYRYGFSETWLYEAAFASSYKWTSNGMVSRTPQDQVYKCYRQVNNSSIVLGSTVNLSGDELKRQLITTIDPMGSHRLKNLYSIKVRQQKISEGAFEFWRRLKNNTEGLGSIFDAQPSQLPTNFEVLNSDEAIIGYLSAGISTEKRFFIKRIDLPFEEFYNPYTSCDLILYPNPLFPEPLVDIFGDGSVIPVTESGPGFYWGTSPFCADCREQGGTTKKPGFWPF